MHSLYCSFSEALQLNSSVQFSLVLLGKLRIVLIAVTATSVAAQRLHLIKAVHAAWADHKLNNQLAQ